MMFSLQVVHILRFVLSSSPEASKFINNKNIKFNPSLEYAFNWASNKNGVCTTKSGYAWLLSHANMVTNAQPSATWSWIWKLKLPKKLKFLFWLVCQNFVPTLFSLNNKNMAYSALCSRCGLEDENFLHCALDCNFSKSIWHHVGFHDENFILDTKVSHWSKEGSLGNLSFIFAATVWWAWCHRNLMCLNNKTWTLIRLSYNIHNMVDSFNLCFKNNSQIDQVDITSYKRRRKLSQ